jgi:hypothetical protein
MKLAAGIVFVLVTLWMVRTCWHRGAADVLMGFGPLVAAITVAVALVYFNCLTLGGVVVGTLGAIGLVLGTFLAVRVVLVRCRKKRIGQPVGRVDRAIGAVFGLFLASYICLLVAEVGSVIVFGVTLSEPPQSQAIPDKSDETRMQWVDSMGDFCSAMADFSADGLLRHVPHAGRYANEARSLVKILNTPPEDLAQVAKKRGMLDLAKVPEIRRAFSDPDYQALLLRMRQGKLKSLYEIAEHQITKDIFACQEIREFVGELKLSDLLADIESIQSARTVKTEAKPSTIVPSR